MHGASNRSGAIFLCVLLIRRIGVLDLLKVDWHASVSDVCLQVHPLSNHKQADAVFLRQQSTQPFQSAHSLSACLKRPMHPHRINLDGSMYFFGRFSMVWFSCRWLVCSLSLSRQVVTAMQGRVSSRPQCHVAV